MALMTLQDGLHALVEQYGADTVAAAVALLVPSIKECKRCGHKWAPRTQGTPRQCPGCHSQGWQTPRLTGPRGRKALQVEINGAWKYVFCQTERGEIITTLERRKALPAFDLGYFVARHANHNFRAEE